MPRSEYLEVAVEAATRAGEIISGYFADLASAAIEDKVTANSGEGLVTKADVEAEKAIIDTIRQHFPDHAFMAEEEHTADAGQVSDLWVIDPLDGTNNFAHGIDRFCVSIAYFKDSVAQIGCIYRPTSEEKFLAIKDHGSWLNDRRVKVNNHQNLSDTLIGCGFHYDRGAMMQATLECIRELFFADIHGIRRYGAAALDLVDVGCGRFGAFFEYALSPWDFAAGKLFVEEAGGRITTCTGEPPELRKTSMIASNGHLHEAVLAITKKHADF
ncbi:MAG: inositol monophosphatase family protein [Planctomycetota bacterium]